MILDQLWAIINDLDVSQRTRKCQWVFEVIVNKFFEDVEAIVILKKANISDLVVP